MPAAHAQPIPSIPAEIPTTPIQLHNQATYTYDAMNEPLCTQSRYNQDCRYNRVIRIQGVTLPVEGILAASLIDPFGQVTGCAGETLTDYTGFSVGLYEPDPTDPTGASFRGLVPLTRTELPDNPNNTIPAGLKPNIENLNPFYLSNGEDGVYNFLLDVRQGQLDRGRTYILVVNPRPGNVYSQRRVKITIGERNGNIVSYVATSLDGKPVTGTDSRMSVGGSIAIRDAAQAGLVLAVLDLGTSICQAQEIQIIKTGDRAAAEPGDSVIYRLSVRNLASAPVNNLVVTDILPLGLNFREQSVRAEIAGTPVPVTAAHQGSTVTFNLTGITLPPATNQNSILNIVYTAVLTPDAIRGSGENRALVQGQRSDNLRSVKDGPVVHRLRVRSGILSDCGTIIGRVFVDKNFDGEQQLGEPGVPNAVVFLEDGTRITTDPNGLFSVANVLSGYRTGVLDLSSLPGYTLAPNRYFHERNSQSRLVHLEPGGLVRMNFAVTPAFRGVGKP